MSVKYSYGKKKDLRLSILMFLKSCYKTFQVVNNSSYPEILTYHLRYTYSYFFLMTKLAPDFVCKSKYLGSFCLIKFKSYFPELNPITTSVLQYN